MHAPSILSRYIVFSLLVSRVLYGAEFIVIKMFEIVKCKFIAMLLVSFVMLFALPSTAAEYREYAVQETVKASVSRREASDLARGHFAGRVLNIIRLNDQYWRVRMDRDGTVFHVFVNTSTGSVSTTEPKNR